MSDESLPTYPELAEKLRQVAAERHEWAGIPIPVGKEYPMTIEPRYPYRLDTIYAPDRVCRSSDVDEACVGWHIVNSWRNDARGLAVAVLRNEIGRARAAISGNGVGLKGAQLVGSIAVAIAWLPAAETKAMNKLWNLVGSHKFHQYTMTGSFMETSPRSQVTYLFRRLRPTLALRPFHDGMRILAALCLHPIGYYRNAWGGVMCPTDDVIAHLVLMRGDEHSFWKQAEQHSPEDPMSGL